MDVVITADVLEHVSDLQQVLCEIARVLKVGGAHAFTVPVELDLTHTRARVLPSSDGPVHVLPRLVHGDTKPPGESLVYRDFGRDAAAATSLPMLPTEVVEQRVGPRHERVFRAVRVHRRGDAP
jgi:ubiquinone/menaquinone biosynthesis C-methylase UbiE